MSSVLPFGCLVLNTFPNVFLFGPPLFGWLTFWPDRKEPGFYVLLSVCFIVKWFLWPVTTGHFKKSIFYLWRTPVTFHPLMTKLPNIDSIFYQKCETKGQSEGLAEGAIHPYSEWKPVHLLRIISCSEACEVPGSFWITQENIFIQYWPIQYLDTLIVPVR